MELKSKFNPLAVVLYSLIAITFFSFGIALALDSNQSNKDTVLLYSLWFLFICSLWIITRHFKRLVISMEHVKRNAIYVATNINFTTCYFSNNKTLFGFINHKLIKMKKNGQT